MNWRLNKIALFTLTMVCCPVATAWAQQPTPTLGCIDDTWTATSTTNAPTARRDHAAVWSGSEMLVWGGDRTTDTPVLFNSGARYNPITDTWTTMSEINAPSARYGHHGIWTGTEMLVWGGIDNSGIYRNTGGRYNPNTNVWIPTSTANAPAGRIGQAAVWTGTEMLVWGGIENSGAASTGGRYNLITDSWTVMSNINAPTARYGHTAVWTGSEMLVWGGFNSSVGSVFNSGARYNPITDTWTTVTTTNAPQARVTHTAVWSGSEMLVWGGFDNAILKTGGRYNPLTDSWTAMSTINVVERTNHTGVWTGTEMLVWSGDSGNGTTVNTGARYNPSTDSWATTSTINAPTERLQTTSIWAEHEMIVWGGVTIGGGGFWNTGGRYCITIPTATPTPTPPPLFSISGTVVYCPNPSLNPVPGVTMTLTGSGSGSTASNGSGNYTFASLAGGSYTITPSKTALTPAAMGINTADVLAVQRHFLSITLIPPGCRLMAADVNGDLSVSTLDVIAIQRFFIGLTFGIGNVGQYKFTPTSRNYPALDGNQIDQNYDALILGDVASPYAE